MRKPVYVNARTLLAPLTGVQRYTLELIRRMKGELVPLSPPGWFASGPLGHVWEQVTLPVLARRGVLFSPAASGPLVHQKQVITVHDLVVYDYPEGFRKEFLAWYRFLLPGLLKKARRVIAVSSFTRSRLLEIIGLPENKVVVIPNGVDHSRFFPRSQEVVEHALTKLRLPNYYVLMLSALNKRKNLIRILQAWKLLSSELRENIWLVVVGAQVNAKVFEEFSLPQTVPNVLYLGYVKDELIPYLYNGALAFVYVSLYEGFGLPPLESMASGTPVLVSNTSSLPEVVGEAGLKVDPYNVEEIAQKLKLLIEDKQLHTQLKIKGLERAKQFSWDTTAELTWKVLQEVAQEG